MAINPHRKDQKMEFIRSIRLVLMAIGLPRLAVLTVMQ